MLHLSYQALLGPACRGTVARDLCSSDLRINLHVF